MKKKNENRFELKYLIPFIIGFILTLFGVFGKDIAGVFEQFEIPFKFFGIAIMAVTCIVRAVKSGDKEVLKSIGVLFLAAVVLTWLLPNGQFSQDTFMDYSYQRFGISDLAITIYYALYFNLDKLIFIIEISALYYLLSKTKAYQKIVYGIAKKLKGIEKYASLLFATIFILLTAFLSQTLVVFIFVPFVLSILSKLKIDKITAFAVTVGAILVGMVGAPFGTEGLRWFGYYASIEASEGLALRLILQGLILISYIAFLLIRSHYVTKKKVKLEVLEDPYDVKENKSKVNSIPLIVVLSLFTIIFLLGYIDWAGNFNINVFQNFHTWLRELSIGEGNQIFAFILGNTSSAFGSWDLITGIVVLFIFILILALMNRSTHQEILDSYVEGYKIIIVPALYFAAAFLVFTILYSTPFMASFLNWAYGLTSGLNSFIASTSAMITSVFHPDLGYTGYLVGGYITSAYSESLSLIQTMFTSGFGFTQIFVPTSGLLVLGLSFTKTSYKEWLKYIFIYLIAVFVIIQVVLLVATHLI